MKSQRPAKRPNIIYIMADDMGYGDLSCYGAEKIQTPNIDAIAKQGMIMTDAHSSSAVCTPSRYSVLTGRYCWRTWLKRGVLGGFGTPLIEKGQTTIASLLQSQGYKTAAVGKWHVGLQWYLKDGSAVEQPLETSRPIHYDGLDIDYQRPITGGPTSMGFDSFFGISGSLDMPPYCFIEDDKTSPVPTRVRELYHPQQRKGLIADGWDDFKVDTIFTEKAVNFIDSHVEENSEDPFFLYLTTAAPHRPCLPPERFKGASQAGARGDMVVVFDWVVGQIDEALKRHNITENTLICITSDNGARATCYNGNDYGHKSCGPLRGQKADIWDGGHRIPFVARWPEKIKPGTTSDDLICLGDMLATAADINAAEIPVDEKLDSQSFLPSLEGKQNGRQHVIHHSADGMFSVRKGKWKLIMGLGSGGFSKPKFVEPTPDGPAGQLYDMEEDLAETTNLWLEKPEIVAELIELLGQAWQNS